MEALKQRILKDGRVANGGILKVDSFLNHQIDVRLYNEMGIEFKKLFSDVRVDRILTIEASGIGIACVAAQYFDVPVVFAKKAKSKNIDGDIYTSTVESFTYGKSYDITVSKKFVLEGESVLIIDDFLANGKALEGLIDIVSQAGAKVVGCSCVIEKGFQQGGDKLREKGIKVESLAIVESMSDDSLTFRK